MILQRLKFILLMLPPSLSAELINLDELDSRLLELSEIEGETLVDKAGDSVVSLGGIMLLAVSIISFLWVTYAAVAKFRECQAGRADWSELLVLGVAAGALLVFITILLSTAGDLLTDSAGSGQ